MAGCSRTAVMSESRRRQRRVRRKIGRWFTIVTFWTLVAICVVAVIGAAQIVWSVTR